jgi:chitinase
VPNNKILGGMALYGHSFVMSDPGCSTPVCTFVNGNTPAGTPEAGACLLATTTLSLTEIYAIANQVSKSPSITTVTDDLSDILIYDSTQWVTFVGPANYRARQSYYLANGYLGISDYVRDLSLLHELN